ncbi:MAG: hypothetical protein LC749_03720 [Actinobacteria bacterium]|nr:hypothetical protein [Actinomycetota bacterium]
MPRRTWPLRVVEAMDVPFIVAGQLCHATASVDVAVGSSIPRSCSAPAEVVDPTGLRSVHAELAPAA